MQGLTLLHMSTSHSLHVALTLISKQAHLLTTTHAVTIVQYKVNGTDPYDNGLFAYRPTAAPVGYGAPVCVEPESSLSMQNNHTPMHSTYTFISCIVNFAY